MPLREALALMLAVATLPAASGLTVKTEGSFGLDSSLEGLPQQMAKLFTLAASGKATPEMMDTDLDELFKKQRALPKEKQLKLSQTMTDMFPEDAVDMDAYLEWKYTPFATALFEAGAQSELSREEQSLLQMSGQQNNTD